MDYDPQDTFKPRKPKPEAPGQFGLFGNPKHLARRDHPETSKEAAESIVEQLGDLQVWALEQVRSHPRETVSEMAARLELRDPRKLGRRLNELARAGRIVSQEKRRCSITGRLCVVYEEAE